MIQKFASAALSLLLLVSFARCTAKGARRLPFAAGGPFSLVL